MAGFPSRSLTAEEFAQRMVGKRHDRRSEIDAEITALEKKKDDLVRQLLPRCREGTCGSTDIRYRLSHHFISPGNNIIGPGGRGPKFAAHVDYLYCGSCGLVYWKEGAEEITTILSEIKDKKGRMDRFIRGPGC